MEESHEQIDKIYLDPIPSLSTRDPVTEAKDWNVRVQPVNCV